MILLAEIDNREHEIAQYNFRLRTWRIKVSETEKAKKKEETYD